MELTPLRRTSSGAVLGGVCMALARRWQVDPTVLRIAMVLLALIGGLGIAFYVGALLLVPKDAATDLPLHKALPFTRTWSPAASIGAVVGLGVLITVLIGSWLPFGIAPAVGLGFLWYFGFYRRRGAQPPAGAATPPGLPAAPDRPLTDFEKAAADWQLRVAEERRNRPQPAPWAAQPVAGAEPPRLVEYRAAVPVGGATAWTPPVPRRRTAPRWLWPLVLCLVGAGLALLAVLSATGLAVPPLAYAGVVLGALGLGLLVAAVAGRPRGLLPLSVLAALVTAVMLVPAPSGNFGDDTFTYSTVAGLPAELNHGAGSVVLDLSAVEVTESRQVEFANGAGDVTVRLPAAGNVVVDWRTGAGDYRGPDGTQDGLGLSGNYERIVTPGGPILTLVVTTGVGDVVVRP